MPVKRRVGKAKAPVTEDQQAWLEGRKSASEFLMSADALATLWAEHGDDVVEAHAEEFPGTRPAHFWTYDAPKKLRIRLGGIGDLMSDHLAQVASSAFGLPTFFLSADDVEVYSGRKLGWNGKPIVSRPDGYQFPGVAVDPNNPPRFESSASYLRRHKLFLPDEAAKLSTEDFEPEAIQP